MNTTTTPPVDQYTRGNTEIMDKVRRHMLLPPFIENALPPIGSAGHVALLKVFDPAGRGTWYFTEFDPETGNGFCYCVSPLGEDCDEYGYANLWELGVLRNRFGIPLERDRFWDPCDIKKVEEGKKR